jgi:hypothetical protein
MLVPFSQVGIDDWVALACRYWADICLIIIAAGVTIFFWIAKRNHEQRFMIAALILLVMVVICAAHIAFTANRNLTLTLLAAEDDRVAEAAYQDFSKQTSLEGTINLLLNSHEDSNVRFYAACLASDKLATNDKQTVTRVMKHIQDAPYIRPRFFGTNSVNKQFFYLTSPISAPSLIEQRLEAIRSSSQRHQ